VPILLGSGFALLIALTAGTAARAVATVREAAHRQELVARQRADDAIAAERLRSSIENLVAASRRHVMVSSRASAAALAGAERVLQADFAALRSRVSSSARESLLPDMAQAIEAYRKAVRSLVDGALMPRRLEAIVATYEVELLPRRRALERAVERFVAHKRERLESARLEGEGLEARATTLAAVALFGGGSASVLLAVILTRLVGRSLRREQEAARRAERAVTQRDEVLGIVAHDLRNPLGAMIMRAARVGATSTDAWVREQAAAIQRAGVRMEHLIRSLLDAAALDMGALTVHREPTLVSDLVREALELHAPAAAQKGVHLEERIPDASLRLSVDRERFLQVLENLMSNAIKFTPAGGTIVVDVHDEAGQLRISVRDSGPGIPAQHLPHLFERLWTAGRGGMRGTGLGLYIAKGIVEAHGGRIQAESPPGRGATLSFTLPLTAPPLGATVSASI
jgi:signal transduction histidine kinase